MTATTRAEPSIAEVRIPQWTRRTILLVWAAAALPMAALAWLIAPVVANSFVGPTALPQAVIVCLTGGLIWQFVLTLIIVRHEQGSLRWSVVRAALWLQAPRRPTTGKVAGVLWLVLIPCVAIFAAEDLLPSPAPLAGHSLPGFLASVDGQSFIAGNWGWFANIVMLAVFNTVLGEELFFRGLLMPRMQRAFGRWDWVVNGVLFACYHLHMPWAIPGALVDTFAIGFASRRYRSALIGIIVHSVQTVMLLLILVPAVLR